MKGQYLILSLVPVLLLSGCKWFGSSTKDAKVEAGAQAAVSNLPEGALAVWGDGKVLVSQKDFDETFELVKKEEPALATVDPSMIPMFQKNILNSMVQQAVIAREIADKGIDKSAEYKAQLDQIIKYAKQRVNVVFFTKEFDFKVTEKDKRDFYEANKDRFAVIAKGGVKAEGIRFDKEADAKAFLTKVGAKVAEFDKLIKADAKLSKALQDFNYVNESSVQIDPVLKSGIIAIAKAPTVVIIKAGDNGFWIVKALDKKASKYRSYDELKDQLEAAVKQTKQGEAVMKRLNEIQAKYGVKINEAAFAPKQVEMPGQQPVAEKTADASVDGQTEAAVAQNDAQGVEKATKAA